MKERKESGKEATENVCKKDITDQPSKKPHLHFKPEQTRTSLPPHREGERQIRMEGKEKGRKKRQRMKIKIHC